MSTTKPPWPPTPAQESLAQELHAEFEPDDLSWPDTLGCQRLLWRDRAWHLMHASEANVVEMRTQWRDHS